MVNGPSSIINHQSSIIPAPPFRAAWFTPVNHNLTGFLNPQYPYAALNDLDGDGKDDVWQWNTSTNAWDIRLSQGRQANGSMTFRQVNTNLPNPGAYLSFAFMKGDFDGDHKLDMALAQSGTFEFLLGAGVINNSLTFNPVNSNFPPGYGSIMYAIVGDFDGDGKVDMAGFNGIKNGWDFFLSQGMVNGQLSFTPVSNNLGAFGAGKAMLMLQTDFDGDGKTDLAYYDLAAKTWTFYLAAGLTNGALTFTQVNHDLSDVWVDGQELNNSIVTVDYNGDGLMDIGSFNLNASAWDIRLTVPTADGLHFERVGANLGTSYADYWIVLGSQGDFDGDSRADIARWSLTNHNWDVRLASQTQYASVDDDYCVGCANDGYTWNVNAFAQIQDAVTASQPGSHILVQPGVYNAFEIGQYKDGLIVTGVDPDAVFVDGGGGDHAVSIHDAVGVTLSGLTLRNATHAVLLKNAGLEGFRNAGTNIILDRLVMYGFDQAVTMDNASALDLSRSTLAGQASSHELISVQPGATPTPGWYLPAQAPLAFKGSIVAAEGALYALFNATPPLAFYRYDLQTNAWLPRATMPDDGRTSLRYSATSGSDGNIYVYTMGVAQNCTTCALSATFYRYQPTSDTWTKLADFADATSGPISAALPPVLSSDGAGSLYALRSGDLALYRYDLSANTATALPATGKPSQRQAGPGVSMTWANGSLWIAPATAGDTNKEFYRYNLTQNAWNKLADQTNGFGDGAALAWDGADLIYTLVGGGRNLLMTYQISNTTWTQVTQNTTFLDAVGAGGALVRLGGSLYFTPGGAHPNFPILRYGPVGVYPRQLTVDRVAFVAPSGVAAPKWFNLPGGFGDIQRATSAWVGGGTWLPALPAPAIAWDAAHFVDPTHNIYRVGAGTALYVGYHTYRPVAYVSPTYCATCANDGHIWGQDAFASIQAAINSGASQALLQPGVYQEPFYLVSGVEVIGAGAAATVVSAPSGQTPLVQAEGIQGATLARLTLDGAGVAVGLRVEDGGQNIELTRSIIRNTQTALSVDGSASGVRLVNNTLVNNVDGLAATHCGMFEARNTIFAFHSHAALNYQSCATTKLHTYNNFWRNGHDLVIDTVPIDTPGAGEVFADPLFTNPSQQDYRPLTGSPVIDAGDPYDPTPPGTGGRVDIGHIQNGQASFYASGAYCETCVNDGLDWQVDAFNTIQTAVDAAARFQQTISADCAPGAALCGRQLTVGVAPGVYGEVVKLPSYIRLVGSGAEQTTIDAGGNGNAVSMINAVQVEVSGFTLTGGRWYGQTAAGVLAYTTSSAITITRNIIRGNKTGVYFLGASGALLHNTIVQNDEKGVISHGDHTWLTVRDNIVGEHTLAGLAAEAGGLLFSDYNLLYLNNGQDYQQDQVNRIWPGLHDIEGRFPQFVDSTNNNFRLQPNSRAIDAGDPPAPVPVGGGDRIDIGYWELLATPLVLILGKEGTTCATGVSGIASVEVGLTQVLDASQPVTATLPSVWTPATVSSQGQAGSYWTASVTPSAGEGLYRLYSRATDVAGNRVGDPRLWFRNAFIADATPPQITWQTPNITTTTSAAAITLSARVSDYAPTGRGLRYNVDTVYFVVDGVSVSADPVGAPQTLDTGQGRVYRAVVPLTNGSHQVSVVARDRAGNQTQAASRSVTVTTPTDVATITTPTDGAATNAPSIQIHGYARFTTANGVGQVIVYVNGQAVGQAQLDDPAAILSAWSATITPPAEGVNTLAAVASRQAPGTLAGAESVNVTVSRAAPKVTLDAPASNAVITQTLYLRGTALPSVGGLPLTSVAVSLDGQVTWLPVTVEPTSGAWSLTWTPPVDTDAVTYAIAVRAVDTAGNVTIQLGIVSVDNWGPSTFAPATFSPDIGSHIQASTSVTVQWTPATDGSGSVSMVVAVDQQPNTLPTQVISGNGYTASFPTAGTWYIHLAAQDAVGNLTVRHFGPWYVGTSGSP